MCHPALLFVLVAADLLLVQEFCDAGDVLLLSLPLVTGDGMPGTSMENDNWLL